MKNVLINNLNKFLILFVFSLFWVVPVQAAKVFIGFRECVETGEMTMVEILELMANPDEATRQKLEQAIVDGDYLQERQALSAQEEAEARETLRREAAGPDGGFATYNRLAQTLVGGENHPQLRDIFRDWFREIYPTHPVYRARFLEAEALHLARVNRIHGIYVPGLMIVAEQYTDLAAAYRNAAEEADLSWEQLGEIQSAFARRNECRHICQSAWQSYRKLIDEARELGSQQLRDLALEYFRQYQEALALANGAAAPTQDQIEALLANLRALFQEYHRLAAMPAPRPPEEPQDEENEASHKRRRQSEERDEVEGAVPVLRFSLQGQFLGYGKSATQH